MNHGTYTKIKDAKYLMEEIDSNGKTPELIERIRSTIDLLSFAGRREKTIATQERVQQIVLQLQGYLTKNNPSA